MRLPVALPARLHDQLARWCRAAAQELNVTALARGDVLEALLAELVTDPATTDAVRRRLRTRLAPPQSPWRGGTGGGAPRGLGG